LDPLAHTLVGATLAETGLKRVSPLATATLVLGANAPDIDIVAGLGGSDAALYWRRGHSHGLVAMLVLPLVLTGVMLLWDRFMRARRDPAAARARPWPLFWLALLSVLSHPALDWLNTYGVRLLMPFDATWFYGDTLFIIDPWLWLLTGAAVVLGRSQARASLAAFIVLGCALTALITVNDLVPPPARVAWVLGVAVIVALRRSQRALRSVSAIALGCVVGLLVYIVAMLAGSRIATAETRTWLARQGIEVRDVTPGLLPANPFVRELIGRTDDTYYFVERSWLTSPGFRFSDEPIAIGTRDEVVEAALGAPTVRGVRAWLRLPSFVVRELADGYEVTIRDVRYARGDSGLGSARVTLDRALRPRAAD
jgi:inner membrane protein